MLKSQLLPDPAKTDHHEKFREFADGLKLFTQTWLPACQPNAVIHLIHGIGEHSGRYSAWASQLAEEGFIVRCFDQRGHGKSGGRRGFSPRYETLLDDIENFMEQGVEEFPSLPSFLYGHSFGGNLVLNYLLRNPQTMKGVIVTSPWLEMTKKPSSLLLTAVSALSRILPGITVDTGLKAEDLSRDLRVVHAYRNDPMVHRKISLRLFTQTYTAGLKAAISIYKINVPLLVMHGTEDKITSCKASQNFVRNAGTRTTFLAWEGGYHELHNDLERDEVFKSLLNWLRRYL